MSYYYIPYFANENGYKIINIAYKKFICIGDNPPLDHPHIFLNMENKKEIICPYCSTIYRFNFKCIKKI